MTIVGNEPTIPVGMKRWDGGDSAPADWDGGPVMLADDTLYDQASDTTGEPLNWEQSVGEGGCIEFWCIIAYTPRARIKRRANDNRHGSLPTDAMCEAAIRTGLVQDDGAAWLVWNVMNDVRLEQGIAL